MMSKQDEGKTGQGEVGKRQDKWKATSGQEPRKFIIYCTYLGASSFRSTSGSRACFRVACFSGASGSRARFARFSSASGSGSNRLRYVRNHCIHCIEDDIVMYALVKNAIALESLNSGSKLHIDGGSQSLCIFIEDLNDLRIGSTLNRDISRLTRSSLSTVGPIPFFV
jgi:hypothetical protein